MNRFTILFFLAFFCVKVACGQEQKLILHPVLGNSIDQHEKTTYLLFPEISTKDFIEAYLVKKDKHYYLHYESSNGKVKLPVDFATLEEYHTNIEKLIAYQAYLDNPDTLKCKPLVVLNQKDTCSLEVNLEYMSPEMRKRLRKDAERYQSLEDDAEDMGYWGHDKENYIKTSGHLIIFSSKSKTGPITP